MNNPSFGALHSPFPSLAIDFQANQRCKEKKTEEEIQQPAFSHGYAKISQSMQNQEEE